MPTQDRDEDAGKGAVEQDRRDEKTNVSLTGEIGQRDQDPLLKSAGSDFPEPGQNEEHTGEPSGKDEFDRDTDIAPESASCDDTDIGPETDNCDQSPGFRQKENQNKSKDDPLAA
jgi:hypothetical protein